MTNKIIIGIGDGWLFYFTQHPLSITISHLLLSIHGIVTIMLEVAIRDCNRAGCLAR